MSNLLILNDYFRGGHCMTANTFAGLQKKYRRFAVCPAIISTSA
jgi:hypothetical protein